MRKNDNIGMAVLVVIGLAIVLAGFDPDGGSSRTSRSRSSSVTQSSSHKATQRAKQQKDEMIRRVNGIVENIGSAEQRLNEAEKMIREEKKALEDVKRNAKTAHLGGQMSDFRTWQRIGREKKDNIEIALKKAEKTITEARRGAESALRRVNWVSDGEKNSHLNRINQRLSQLGKWTSTLEQVSGDLAKHATWLDANE